MQGLLADVNVQGHLVYIQKRLLPSLGLWAVIAELGLRFVTFNDLVIPPDIEDRTLWNLCQVQGWVLFTENRNNDGPDSLQQTLFDSWREGLLPVFTLANKSRFDHDRDYAARVATDIANLLFDIATGQYRDQPRIWVPRT
jgi:hypothetical protein